MSLSDPAFRVIFDNVPVGIVVVDRELKIVDANAAYCDMLGYGKGELLALSIPEVTHPEDRQRDIEFVKLLREGHLPRYRAEKRYVRKDGRIVWVSLVAMPLLDESGRALYTFGMVQDITERKMPRGPAFVCPSCRKIRDQQGYWAPVEDYLRAHGGFEVSPEACPECARKGPAA